MMEDEKLIYMVQQYEFLYDLAHPKYMDNVRKDAAWKEISEHMKQPASTCKNRWQSLRDSFRRVLNKRKCKNSTAIKIKKWKYEEEMAFLEQYFVERKAYITPGANSDEDISDNDLTRNVETLMDVPEIKIEPQELDQPHNVGDNVSVSPSTLEDTKKPKAQKRKRSPDANSTSAAAVFLSNFLEHRTSPEPANDDIDLFFKSIASTVKKFSPYLQALVKNKVFNIVSQMEIQLYAPKMEKSPENFDLSLENGSYSENWNEA